MRVAKVSFESKADLFFGRHIAEKKQPKETHEQFEDRTWAGRINVNNDGVLVIPHFALKNGLESAGKWLGMPIPGEGKKNFTKRFASGTMVSVPLELQDPNTGEFLTVDDIKKTTMFVPSDGQRGGKKRVIKHFPRVERWKASAEILVLDDKIDERVMLEHLEAIGNFIGFGSMRVENGGINGRFDVTSLELPPA